MTVNALKKKIINQSDVVDSASEVLRSLNRPSPNNDLPLGNRQSIDLDVLNQLIPVRSMSEEVLTAFSIGGYAEQFESSTKLFTEGDTIQNVLYLLDGTVRIDSENGKGYEVSAGSAQARFPLSTGVMHASSGKAVTAVTVLRVSNIVMADSQDNVESENMGESLEIAEIPAELEDSQLFQAIYQNYREEELALSILPTVADVIKRAIARDINNHQLARLIETDAVMTAKVLSVANSPLFHSTNTIYTVLDAIDILGIDATRYVITNACDKYKLTSTNQPYVDRIQQSCLESLRISGLCFALASLTELVDPKRALTAGLMSNIGIMPFANYVDKFPIQMYNEDEIETGWPVVRGFMGSFVLEKLRIPKLLAQIPQLSSDMNENSGNEMEIADIVLICRLINSGQIFQYDHIPAIQKLGGNGITPELVRMLNQISMKRIKRPLAVVKQKRSEKD
ncbi:MAG: HDOD domain-containing protein [Gammaproteobacteria bacterium]|nr:HDOD domain-containing protein [Gammaproteobacteria bacterium]